MTTRRPKGTGSIYQRPDSAVFWLKYSRHGKPYRESSGTTDRRKAERMLKVRLSEITTGTFIGPQSEKIKVAELAEDFLREYRINERKSIDDATARWKLHLEPFFGARKAIDVSSDLVSRYAIVSRGDIVDAMRKLQINQQESQISHEIGHAAQANQQANQIDATPKSVN
jgi:hypothetical protein